MARRSPALSHWALRNLVQQAHCCRGCLRLCHTWLDPRAALLPSPLRLPYSPGEACAQQPKHGPPSGAPRPSLSSGLQGPLNGGS